MSVLEIATLLERGFDDPFAELLEGDRVRISFVGKFDEPITVEAVVSKIEQTRIDVTGPADQKIVELPGVRKVGLVATVGRSS